MNKNSFRGKSDSFELFLSPASQVFASFSFTAEISFVTQLNKDAGALLLLCTGGFGFYRVSGSFIQKYAQLFFVEDYKLVVSSTLFLLSDC